MLESKTLFKMCIAGFNAHCKDDATAAAQWYLRTAATSTANTSIKDQQNQILKFSHKVICSNLSNMSNF